MISEIDRNIESLARHRPLLTNIKGWPNIIRVEIMVESRDGKTKKMSTIYGSSTMNDFLEKEKTGASKMTVTGFIMAGDKRMELFNASL